MGRLRTLARSVGLRSQADPADERVWTTLYGGGMGYGSSVRQTTAGPVVTHDKALELPAYLAAIKNKSEDIAAQPWQVFEPKPDGRGKRKAEGSALWTMLHDEFNPYMTAFTGVELLCSWAFGWGLGLAWIERAGTEPVNLWPIHPSKIIPRWVPYGEVNEPVYFVRNDKDPSKPIPIRGEDAFVVFGLGQDGLHGYSVAHQIAQSIGIGLAAETYSAAVFGNDTALGVVFTTDEEMSDEAYERMKASIKELSQGASKAFEPFIAEGAKVSRLGIPPKDAQMIETQRFTVEQVARTMRMPLHLVGEREPFASIEQLGIEYARFSLNPWCVRLQREAQRKLIRDKRGWSSKIMLQGLMAGDYTGRTAGYRTMISTGAMTPNEARELEDQEPSDEPGADMLWMQGAMAPIGKLAAPVEETEPEPDPEDPEEPSEEDDAEEDDAEEPGDGEDAGMEPEEMPPEDDAESAVERLRPVFGETAQRVVSRQTRAVVRAAEKHAGDVESFVRWAGGFFDAERAKMAEAFGPACEAAGSCPEAWLLNAAHDLAREAGKAALRSFCDAQPLPPQEVRARTLAEDMMTRAVRAREEAA